ncbi:Sec-independent protein translocase protein TatB [uncultured Campylobacter sp.]|uniref:Sec-independent protein translocase protein TatB n=1 Tax=uncultured Campylobacter sp. TaxID=218934 RepID=UPI0026103DBE|nr:Sec-independent protein translocase protein TatB [uncultured Campylobacter sp.]
MFGISMPEITVILIIAIIVLGPEKLPKVLVELAKYFKVIKKTINDAKSSFDQELRIAELKEDAKKYKESITQASEGVRKKLTFEELDEIKGGIDSVKETLNAGLKNIEGSVKDTLNSAEVSAQKQNETANLKANSSGENSAQSSAGAANSTQGSAGSAMNSGVESKSANSGARNKGENFMPSTDGGAGNSAQNTKASGEAKGAAQNLNANLNGDARNSTQNSAQNNDTQKS